MKEVLVELLKAASLPIGAMTGELIVDLVTKAGKLLGKRAADFYEENSGKTPEELKNMEVPAGLQEEITGQIKQYVAEQKQPVYMDGVVFFMEEEMKKDVQDALQAIMEYKDKGNEDEILDEGTRDFAECIKEVDDIIDKYMQSYASKEENDFGIMKDSFYINFELPDNGWNIYNPEEIRGLADAINKLLETNTETVNRIVSYMVF